MGSQARARARRLDRAGQDQGTKQPLTELDQGPRPPEHGVPHAAREPARVRVLPARMVGSDEHRPVGEPGDGPVREAGALARWQTRPPPLRPEPAVVSDAAEDHNDPRPPQQPELSREVWPAALQLDTGGLVTGRRAARGRRDIAVAELEAVVTRTGVG